MFCWNLHECDKKQRFFYFNSTDTTNEHWWYFQVCLHRNIINTPLYCHCFHYHLQNFSSSLTVCLCNTALALTVLAVLFYVFSFCFFLMYGNLGQVVLSFIVNWSWYILHHCNHPPCCLFVRMVWYWVQMFKDANTNIAGSGRAIWYSWIMSPALMTCWCSLSADFLCTGWMMQSRYDRLLLHFNTWNQYSAVFYVFVMFSTVHIRTKCSHHVYGWNTLDL